MHPTIFLKQGELLNLKVITNTYLLLITPLKRGLSLSLLQQRAVYNFTSRRNAFNSCVCYVNTVNCWLRSFKHMKNMSQSLKVAGVVALLSVGVLAAPASYADSITPKTVGAGVLSLIIPGIGQAINSSPGDKVVTHLVLGLVPPFHFWSAYDALVNRKGGYWDGRI